MAIKTQSRRRKGAKLEKWCVAELRKLGIETARPQPGSGIYSDFPHDVYFKLPDGPVIVECKQRRVPPQTLDRWLGKAECLVIRGDAVNQHDRPEARVYMTWTTFERLIGLALEAQREAA